MPAIDFCFEQAGWERSDIDAVAVDVGPGPFTGIRAGIATAQAFAAGVGAPLVAVSSLTIQALRASTGHRRIWSVVESTSTGGGRPVSAAPGGVAPDGLAEVLGFEEFRAMLDTEESDTLVVGDWQALPEAMWGGLHRVRRGRPRYPAADVMLEIAAIRVAHGEFVSAEDVRPAYMREPDVQINWKMFRSEGLWP